MTRCWLRAAPDCTGRAGPAHHRKLRKHGGGDTPDNLMCDICPMCHRHIHMHPEIAYRNGWMVHPWDDPADIPIVYPQAA